MSSTRDQFKPEHPRHDDPNTGPSGEPEKIPYPGMTEEMQQKPDHGEKSYRGTGTCCSMVNIRLLLYHHSCAHRHHSCSTLIIMKVYKH
jgi:hypothetical protein